MQPAKVLKHSSILGMLHFRESQRKEPLPMSKLDQLLTQLQPMDEKFTQCFDMVDQRSDAADQQFDAVDHRFD